MKFKINFSNSSFLGCIVTKNSGYIQFAAISKKTMTKSIFICGIHNIQIEEDLGDGIELTPNSENSEYPTIFITNNKKKIRSLLTADLVSFIGTIEFSYLYDGYPIIAYTINDLDLKTTTSIEHLDKHLYLLKLYFFCLWLTKDNAADFDIGFVQFLNLENSPTVSSNNMSSTNFNVSGTRDLVNFSVEELKLAAQYFTDTLYLGHTNVPPIANTTSTERITIANHFVQIAIASKDLGIKAVGYCSALETLFSNGENTELAHKLSERIAKFLEKDLDKRVEIYKTVKKIYEIRSKVVHGATIRPAKLDELSKIVKEADEICRRIMIYAFTVPNGENIFEKSREHLDQFFSELILG